MTKILNSEKCDDTWFYKMKETKNDPWFYVLANKSGEFIFKKTYYRFVSVSQKEYELAAKKNTQRVRRQILEDK